MYLLYLNYLPTRTVPRNAPNQIISHFILFSPFKRTVASFFAYSFFTVDTVIQIERVINYPKSANPRFSLFITFLKTEFYIGFRDMEEFQQRMTHITASYILILCAFSLYQFKSLKCDTVFIFVIFFFLLLIMLFFGLIFASFLQVFSFLKIF